MEDVCDRVTILFGGKVQASGKVDELLTDSDATILETERLGPETLGKIRRLLADEQRDLRRVDAPRRKLEALFLEIVRKAQRAGVETQGVKAGGAVAEFLAAGAAARPAEGEAVVEALVAAGKARPQPDVPKAAPPARQVVDAAVLEGLTGEKRAEGAEKESKPEETQESIDRKVIDDLTGGR